MEIRDDSWWVLKNPWPNLPKVVQVKQVTSDDDSTYIRVNDINTDEFVVVISDSSAFKNFSRDDEGRPYLLKSAWLLYEVTPLMKELL